MGPSKLHLGKGSRGRGGEGSPNQPGATRLQRKDTGNVSARSLPGEWENPRPYLLLTHSLNLLVGTAQQEICIKSWACGIFGQMAATSTSALLGLNSVMQILAEEKKQNPGDNSPSNITKHVRNNPASVQRERNNYKTGTIQSLR